MAGMPQLNWNVILVSLLYAAIAKAEQQKANVAKLAGPLVVLLLVCSLPALHGCASWKPIARTADGVAETLCAQFFAEQKPGLSLEDAAKEFCATEADLRPWIDQVLAAKQTAGTQALARSGASP